MKDLPVKMKPFDVEKSQSNYWRSCLIIDEDVIEDPEESDFHNYDYVCFGWDLNWSPVEMEMAVGCSWIEYRY